jgi:hypothetical protein
MARLTEFHHQHPQLFSFVTDQNISKAKFLSQDAYENFHTPLLVIALDQLQELVALVQLLTLQDQPYDCWTYLWGNGLFSSKNLYWELKGIMQVSPLFNWMWKSCVQGKHKFFTGF